MILANSVNGANKIASGQIDSSKIENSSLITNNFENSSVISEKIADNAVQSAQLAPDSVDGNAIADTNVLRTHLTGNFSAGHFADPSVDTIDIGDGAVNGTTHISNNQISNAKILVNGIRGEDFTDNTISNNYISSAIGQQITGTKFIGNTIINEDIDLNSIATVHLQTVNASNIGGAIDNSVLINDSLTNGDFAPNSIGSPKLASSTIGPEDFVTTMPCADGDVLRLNALREWECGGPPKMEIAVAALTIRFNGLGDSMGESLTGTLIPPGYTKDDIFSYSFNTKMAMYGDNQRMDRIFCKDDWQVVSCYNYATDGVHFNYLNGNKAFVNDPAHGQYHLINNNNYIAFDRDSDPHFINGNACVTNDLAQFLGHRSTVVNQDPSNKRLFADKFYTMYAVCVRVQ